jgi:hypothetical protein
LWRWAFLYMVAESMMGALAWSQHFSPDVRVVVMETV